MMTFLHRAWPLLVALTILTFAMVLGGCTPTPHPDTAPPRIETVTIDRVVATTCIAPADIPAVPAKAGQSLTGEARHDASVLAASDMELRAALDQAVALLGGCVER